MNVKDDPPIERRIVFCVRNGRFAPVEIAADRGAHLV